MLSGNENKIGLETGTPRALTSAHASDNLTLLDFSSDPPAVTHIEDVSNTVIGPPSNIAFTADGARALIADSLLLDAKNTNGYSPNNRIHVLDLRAKPPRLVGEVKVGKQPSGMSVTPDGRRALVANRADGTVSILDLTGSDLRELEQVRVCLPEESVSDVAIAPSGKIALVSVQKPGYLAVLKLEGDRVTLQERRISVYGQPYRCVVTPDGQLGLTAGQGFGKGGLDADALSVIDMNKLQMIDLVPLATGPESIEISPDGRLLAAVLMAGSNLATNDPQRTPHGKLIMLARRDRSFVKVQALDTGAIPEGVAFSPDGRRLVVQAHEARQLIVYAVEGEQVKETTLRISTRGMPSSLRTYFKR